MDYFLATVLVIGSIVGFIAFIDWIYKLPYDPEEWDQ